MGITVTRSSYVLLDTFMLFENVHKIDNVQSIKTKQDQADCALFVKFV